MKATKLNCEIKWENILDKQFHWNKIWQSLGKSKASLKAKQLHWKTLHHAIFTEHKLNLMGFSNGICVLCTKQRETLQHLFWECSHAQAIWESIFPILDKVAMNTLNYEIEKPQISCLLGIHYKPSVCKFINTIILEAKWFIWKSRNIYKYEKRYMNKNTLLHASNDR